MTTPPSSELDLIDAGQRLVSLTFSVTLFTDVPLTDIPDQVLALQDAFFGMCLEGTLRFYATENMRRHRPVGKKTRGMLQERLSAPSAKPEYIVLELKDGDLPEDAPKHFFKVVGCEKGSIGYEERLANAVCLAFPPELALEDPKGMEQLVTRLSADFPFQSGSAGFAFHCSRYATQQAESYAYGKSMQFRDVDIVRLPQDIHAVAQNAIKTIGWITAVGTGFVKQLGGIDVIKKQLGPATTSKQVKGGWLFRVGNAPALMDRNRDRGDLIGDYAGLYRALAPLIEVAADQSQWFDLGGSNEDDQTRAWYRRFEA